jgi:two-component system OmpR family sensor kinase
LAFSGSAALLAIGLIWLLIRRDLKVLKSLSKAAAKISQGGEQVSLPQVKASDEVMLLSNSLGDMVETLESAITTERNAQKAIQVFVGDASHELRTPLTVIKGYTELLQSQGDDAAFRSKALERVAAEVTRMDQLISDMLTMAELAEERHAERTVVNLSQLVEEAVTDFATLSTDRTVESEIAAGIGITGAQDQLHQLLNNILSNIQRHTPVDAKVQVALTTTSTNVHLTVNDAGPGLPEEAYQRGIDGFERFDPFAARANGGTGLGMTIMRKIVADHGGKIVLSKSHLGGLRTEITLAR